MVARFAVEANLYAACGLAHSGIWNLPGCAGTEAAAVEPAGGFFYCDGIHGFISGATAGRWSFDGFGNGQAATSSAGSSVVDAVGSFAVAGTMEVRGRVYRMRRVAGGRGGVLAARMDGEVCRGGKRLSQIRSRRAAAGADASGYDCTSAACVFVGGRGLCLLASAKVGRG